MGVRHPVSKQLNEPPQEADLTFEANVPVHFHSALHPEDGDSRKARDDEELENKYTVEYFIHKFH